MTLTNQNIEQLLVLCKKENQLAQLEVYKRYYLAMYNIALRIVKNEAEAEDIMQEAFLTAFTKLEKLKDLKSFGSWLKRIVINHSISKYNKQVFLMDLEEERHDSTDAEDNFGEPTEKEVRENELLECMKGLKDKYRVILTLYYLEDYSHEDISKAMKLSYANCRTLLSRAKESLRKKYDVHRKLMQGEI